MAEGRQPRAASEDRRRSILDATEEIMLKDGYAAVSSRAVATAAGMQASLVHYYFATIDDLFVALIHRRAARNVERMAAALLSAEPLRAWWRLASDRRGTSLFVELLAAANHRPALKAEVGVVAREVRRMQTEVLERVLPEYGVDRDLYPPPLVAAAIQGLAFSAVQDSVAGYDTHAEEAIAAMDRLVDRLEASRAKRITR